MNNFLIDLFEVKQYFCNEETTIAIILHKTGVEYTAQADGLACSHPRAEGFFVVLGDFAQDFDQCNCVCYLLSVKIRNDLRENLAADFDKYCDKYFADSTLKYTIRFDYDRINELMEGWIPVIINGILDEYHNTCFDNCQAIIHTGNCD